MYHFINSLAHTASVLILVVIAIERYFAVLHPFKCRRVLTIKRLRFVILGVWLASAMLCAPRLFYIETMTNPLPRKKGQPVEYEVICTLEASIYDSKTADMIQFIILFFLPLMIISILYAKVCLILHQRETFVGSFVQASLNLEQQQQQQPLQQPQQVEERTRENGKISIFENLHRKVSFKETSQNDRGNNKNFQNLNCSMGGNKSPNNKRLERGYSRRAALVREESISSSCSLSCSNNNYCNNNGNKRRSYSIRRGLLREGSISSTATNNGPVGRGTSGGTSSQNPHKGVIRMLVAILITFAICNFPYHLRKLHQNFFLDPISDSVWSQLETPLSFLLMYTNCAINPILYAFMSRSFRSCFMDCVRCQVKKPNQNS